MKTCILWGSFSGEESMQCNLEILSMVSQVYLPFISQTSISYYQNFLVKGLKLTQQSRGSRVIPLGFGRAISLSEAQFSLLWHGRETRGEVEGLSSPKG